MYYIGMLVVLTGILIVLEILFSQVEQKQNSRLHNYSWYLQFNNNFNYRRTASTTFLFVILYLATSQSTVGSMEWIIGLLGYLAIGLISNILSTYAGFMYKKKKFKKQIEEVNNLQKTIREQLQLIDDSKGVETPLSYDVKIIVEELLNDDMHLAIASKDGGEFVSTISNLPLITYVVETESYEASNRLEDTGVKVTNFTEQGGLPFKDERLDIVVNKLTHFDRHEIARVIKTGGKVVIEQSGSQTFNEVLQTLPMVRMKGAWDLQNCITILEDTNLMIEQQYEDVGKIRFTTLASTVHYLNNNSTTNFNDTKFFFNLHARIQQAINNEGFFELTIHKFLVVARKLENNSKGYEIIK